MTTEYENFQEDAQKEVSYMKIDTIIDLAYRDRLMPPPLNILVYPIGWILHIILSLLTLTTCCGCDSNLYARINRSTFLCLDAFYCGCNSKMRKRFKDKKNTYKQKDALNDKPIQQSLYGQGKCNVISQLLGLTYVTNKISYSFDKRCKRFCTKDKKKKRKKIKKKYNDQPLNAYHKGCYSCIKLIVKDELQDDDDEMSATVRGITMKEYIQKYEHVNKTKLHIADTVLLKHLTVDTLFCRYCYQPFLEHQVDKSLLTPFRVLVEIISCIMFLFTARDLTLIAVVHIYDPKFRIKVNFL